ncbi:MAG TPA: diacylglycerol kinase family protein [Gemmatimonadales bacterium]
MTRLPIIVNPVAGGGRARRAAARVVALLRADGVAADLFETSGPGHARQLAESLVGHGAPRVVACGGDGTQHEVASALVGTDTILGILPFGRGNDLAKAMGVPSDVAAASSILRTGAIRRIDVGYANGTPFCTVTSAGFDAEVSNLTRTGLWRHLGPLTYPLGVLAGLLRLRVPMMRVEGDFGVREGRYVLVAASNTGIYGGGIRIAPDSVPDDGLFDCCLVRDIPPWKLLTIFPKAYSGGHVRHPEVEIVRSRAVRITAVPDSAVIADGESVGRTPLDVTLRPRALAVLVPAGSPASGF